ncbi:hypothetical protein EUU23_01205 [Sphingorhabdus sp. IMCC26285]|uniref:Uncharacterized protein n=1 Tax=Sphingorhabdus profundilacus TaxID=2509718 RepID=A0A6I4LSD4_9SPHN|nr:hypothetical protein [Sphingorhabdus profundilacus]MVZ96317.1 hypothetical protein [Sphingorhabdus profundilacus]
MKHSSSEKSPEASPSVGYSRESRASWIGSKLAQSTGIGVDQLDAVHNYMWLRILQSNAATPTAENEADHLAMHIVKLSLLAENAAAQGGPKAAMAAVMQARGDEVDPLLAQNFLKLASSSIFWMALDSAGEARA